MRMPMYRNSERNFPASSVSSLDRLGKPKFKRIRQPRSKFPRRFVRHKNESSEWVFTNQDGENMSFEANSHMVKNFQKIHTIGKGGFGTVIKVRHKIDNGFYAIKCILLDLMDAQSNYIMKEVKLLSQLMHDNIVRYFTTWIDDCNVNVKAGDEDIEGFSETSSIISSKSSAIVFQDASNVPDASPKCVSTQVLCIHMEFCKTTLADAINVNLHKKAARAWRIFWEIVKGLAYLNKKGILHRDLKPQNIFLDTDDRVKIGDFGLATKIFRGSPAKGHIANSLSAEVGSSFYRAPELNEVPEGSKTRYGQEVDIFSLGIILFEIFHPPFSTGSERYRVITDLRKKDIIMPMDFIEDEKNCEVINIIRSLLNHNACARPTCNDLLSKQKPKQITNHRKSIQKHTKKTNANSNQQLLVTSGNPDHHNNGDMSKTNNIVNCNARTFRYIWYEDYNTFLHEAATAFKNALKLQHLTDPKLACVSGPIQAVTLNEVRKAIALWTGYADSKIHKIAKHVVKIFNEIIKRNKILVGEIENDCTNAEITAILDIIQQSWEIVIAGRISRVMWRNPCQYTSDGKFKEAFKVFMDRYTSIRKDVYVIFIRLEKYLIPHELIWTALRSELVPEQYIDLIKTIHFNVPKTRRPTFVKNNSKTGVPQGSVLGPLLFNTFVNYVTKDFLDPEMTFMYRNNIVLASETVGELLNAFNLWRETLENGGLRIVRNETKIFYYIFSGASILPKVSEKFILAGTFPYLIDPVVDKIL